MPWIHLSKIFSLGFVTYYVDKSSGQFYVKFLSRPMRRLFPERSEERAEPMDLPRNTG